MRFGILLQRYRRGIADLGITRLFTRTYSALWWCAFSTNWRAYYYAPGLGNPLLIGRRPALGRVFSGVYNYLQGRALARTTVAFAAASEDEIAKHNRYLTSVGLTRKYERLPTAVNTDLFKPRPRHIARGRLGIAPSAKVFVYSGRLARVKGIDLLLESFRTVRKRYSDSVFLMAGHGEEEEWVRRTIEAMDLGNSVVLLGNIPPEQLAVVIAAANACVVGSHTEGFSLAMLEHAACGRPIVSTDVSGARDIICDGVNGFIVHQRDPDIFAAKMIDATALSNVARYSCRLVEENYSEERLWQSVLQRVNAD